MTSYVRLFCYLLDYEKCCRNGVDPDPERSKNGRLEKEYIHSDWNSDPNFSMLGGQGGDLSACKRIFNFPKF